jgi:hypothetical protein
MRTESTRAGTSLRVLKGDHQISHNEWRRRFRLSDSRLNRKIFSLSSILETSRGHRTKLKDTMLAGVRGQTMPHYRVYVLDESSQLRAAVSFDCADDDPERAIGLPGRAMSYS